MKTYKVIIVDDEPIIRNGLSKFTDWKYYGFNLINSFEDGKEAIEFLECNHVDLIISDIKMVNKSGLDIAEYVYKNKLPTKIVLLSGYRDFEYAKQAISFNVTQYLLKPFEEEEMDLVLKTVYKDIQLLNEEKENEKKFENYKEILPLIRQEFFSDLYIGMLKNTSQYKKRIKIAGLEEFENNSCCILNITIKGFETALEKYDFGKERLKQEILLYISHEKDEEYYVVYSRSEKIKIIVFSQKWNDKYNQDECIKKIREHLKDIKNLINVELDMEIEKYFDSLLQLRDYRILSVNEIFEVDKQKVGVSKEDLYIIEEQFYKLASELFFNDITAVKECIDEIESEICNLPLIQYRELYVKLIEVVNKRLEQAGKEKININLLDDNFIDKKVIYKTIFKELETISHILQVETNASQMEIIQKIQKYIEDNYHQQITLEDMALQVYLSSSYISRLFKQITGITIMDYVIKCRIKNAISLLKSGKYKIFEISEMVGYSSVQYFTRQFKSVTGYSPKQYTRKA